MKEKDKNKTRGETQDNDITHDSQWPGVQEENNGLTVGLNLGLLDEGPMTHTISTDLE